jgi:hypothetical protein
MPNNCGRSCCLYIEATNMSSVPTFDPSFQPSSATDRDLYAVARFFDDPNSDAHHLPSNRG